MGVAFQTVIVGASIGSVYALVGLGFTLVWALSRTLALAHGDTVVAAVLLAVLIIVGRTPVAARPSVAASIGLVAFALLTGVVLSLAVYAVAVRPSLRRTDLVAVRTNVLGWAAGTIAAGLAIRTLLTIAFPGSGYAVPDPLHLDGLTSSGVISLPNGASAPVRAIAVFVVATVIALLADGFITRSRSGRALRAVADDREAATLCGIPIERSVLLAFGLAGLLAAVAGLLDAPDTTVTVDGGVIVGLAGAAAAVVGGLGSPRGALAGGLVIGLAQQTVVALPGAGPHWSSVAPLLVLLLALTLRPTERLLA